MKFLPDKTGWFRIAGLLLWLAVPVPLLFAPGGFDGLGFFVIWLLVMAPIIAATSALFFMLGERAKKKKRITRKL